MADEEKEGRRRAFTWSPYSEDSYNHVPGTNQASTAQTINSSDMPLPPPQTQEAARLLLTTTGDSSPTTIPGTSTAPIQQQNARHPEGIGEGSNQEHGSKADEEPRNSCTFSQEALWCAEDLEQRTRENVNKRKHLCRECGKCFPCLYELERHYRIHTGEKPYTCKVCQQKFAQESHLTQHHMTHTDEQPFCCGYCGTKFKRKGDKKRHINKQHQNTVNTTAQLQNNSPEKKM